MVSALNHGRDELDEYSEYESPKRCCKSSHAHLRFAAILYAYAAYSDIAYVLARPFSHGIIISTSALGTAALIRAISVRIFVSNVSGVIAG